jgi:hypothetical protein
MQTSGLLTSPRHFLVSELGVWHRSSLDFLRGEIQVSLSIFLPGSFLRLNTVLIGWSLDPERGDSFLRLSGDASVVILGSKVAKENEEEDTV